MVTEPDYRYPIQGSGSIRRLAARWVLQGNLETISAIHLGSGVIGNGVDMAVLRDRMTGSPLLTGASLAGSLRSYLADREAGYGIKEQSGQLDLLFGGTRGDDQGYQSALIVFDSVGKIPAGQGLEIRDGVTLDAKKGTAAEHLKYDLEILPSGTHFPIRLELLVGDTANEERQISLLAAALHGLEGQEIPMGARKGRGLGRCQVQSWKVQRFDLTTQSGWLEWLLSDHCEPLDSTASSWATASEGIHFAWERPLPALETDKRRRVMAVVDLSFTGGLLVRSPGVEAQDPDAAHLKSGGNSVLPGTSLAGALRARAIRIANIVRSDKGDGEHWVGRLFGPPPLQPSGVDSSPEHRPDQKLHASRLRVSESALVGGHRLRPSRIRVDRFTGGVVDGGLFDEEPDYRGAASVQMELREPLPGETGLMLLLLKDLLSGDLPLGGTSSVGRGMATGKARISLPDQKGEHTLEFAGQADTGTAGILNEEVRQFYEAELCR